ncbi:helix-turn-helix domain-containing protein [Breoghania sp. L-A4]|uniref:helix-turn-helix domain-containing protein n=1 Tax=Breoghania sp. L-A4 TaxID=2304600 RepID=UPI000E35EE9E|nr:helix-turn-helix domain-containing protein [Breoghania sp. L-A4]AXS39929.1 chromosomal replication initiator DnaA [Breoghania sp. L-A4]
MTVDCVSHPDNHGYAGRLGAAVYDHDAANCGFVEAAITTVFNVTPEALRAPTRSCAEVALARQVAMYVMHVVFGWSLTSVGRHFGRDRTTAGHACRRVEDQRDDPAFDAMLTAIERAAAACRTAARVRWEWSH